jgi:hypothetical protein
VIENTFPTIHELPHTGYLYLEEVWGLVDTATGIGYHKPISSQDWWVATEISTGRQVSEGLNLEGSIRHVISAWSEIQAFRLSEEHHRRVRTIKKMLEVQERIAKG